MRKKLLALFLALCCLTVPANAESITVGTPYYSSLQEFLTFLAFHGRYDSQNVMANGETFWGYKPANIMDSLVDGEVICCDYSIYPVEQPEWDWDKPDPLNRLGGYAHATFPVSSVEWVLKNIFNCSQANVDALEAYLDKSPAYYRMNGRYYTAAGGVGFDISPRIRNITAKGTQYCVTYDIINNQGGGVYPYYAVLKLKDIDGGRYWSVYSNQALAPGQDPTQTGGFIDIQPGAYYCGSVLWAVGQGIASGTSAATFSPDGTCTNAQILTFLWRANGSPEPRTGNPFSDVSTDSYYYKPALWAYEKGLVSGKSFNAVSPCTRAMAVTYLWKLAGSPAASGGRFSDVPDGAAYAQAVDWAVNRGVTSGTSASTFAPHTVCTRGQIMTFLYRNAHAAAPAAPAWSGAYEDFITGRKYLTAGQEYGEEHSPFVNLYDMDKDGTPELIMDNGYDGRAVRCAYVYTYAGGAVKYLGVGPTDAFYSQNAAFPGIFGYYHIMADDHSWSYYWKDGDKYGCETVYLQMDGEIQEQTGNSALLAEVRKESNMQRLKSGSSVAEIGSSGWDAFVGQAWK